MEPTSRIHGLDAVRGGALLLGVLLHATMSFLPGPQLWHLGAVTVADGVRQRGYAVSVLIGMNVF